MPKKSLSKYLDSLSLALFFLSIAMVLFACGLAVSEYKLFPYEQIKSGFNLAKSSLLRMAGNETTALPFYFSETARVDRVLTRSPVLMQPGLTVISGITHKKDFRILVVDDQGNEIHRWTINPFQIWPDFNHIPEEDQPKSAPGTHVHGIQIIENGDIVFNLERVGLTRMDACGNVVWNFPHRTHHSIDRDDQGNFWVPGQINHYDKEASIPNYHTVFQEFTILKVSSSGELLEEISIFDLLHNNGLSGLLYMSSIDNWDTVVHGDTLHLNDIEIFSNKMTSGIFQAGDIMISLRNINSVMVFDGSTHKLKASSIGQVLRQHDPDFVDGNTVTIFDNNNLLPDVKNPSSRIALWDTRDNTVSTVFEGSQQTPFFTYIMGKHQRLPNGNMLLVESSKGRVVEITGDNEIVWDYMNIIADGLAGIVDDAQRLPIAMNQKFFSDARESCQ